jgi:hypothetical protein
MVPFLKYGQYLCQLPLCVVVQLYKDLMIITLIQFDLCVMSYELCN